MNTIFRSPSPPDPTKWLKRVGFTLPLILLPWISAQTQKEPVRTSITVIERIETETPAFLTPLTREEIQQQPGVNLDDRLRALPGFSLFRRSSSLVANPTTQGVSLRGLGSSGASRSLVLWDGVPINDPFGGWIYWTRVAPEEIERVEVSRGAATSVFGDRAMSGAIALFSRPVQPLRLVGAYEGGTRNTHMLTGGISHLWTRFGASAQVRAFTTDGYYIVPEERRGTQDTPANVRFVAGDTRLDYLGGRDRLFLRLDVLAEERDNGTALTHNSTSLGNIAANYSREWNEHTLSVLGYHTRSEYRASFSAVAADRNSERLTFLQTVPSEAVGGAGLYQYGRSTWNLLAGADVQRVEGSSNDRLFPTGIRVGGGSQLQHGLFSQWNGNAGPVRLFLGARHQFAGQDSRFFSPSAGAVAGRGLVRGRASVYRAFRAPTLNELYRDFRAGNAETRSNPQLKPETLFGAETGIDLISEHWRVSFGAYRNSLGELITNVTLSSTPQLIVRQRRNAGSALTRGFDMNAQATWRNWRGELSALFADSRFATGERIPQVPRFSGNAQLTYSAGRWLASGGLRGYSMQYEDDRNQFPLPGYTTINFAAQYRLTRGLFAHTELENLANREFLVGYSPVPLIGAPRLWRGGFRIEIAK